MVTVKTVIPGSLCDRHGVLPGDVLVSVNGNEIRDVLDYRFYICERKVELVLTRGCESYGIKLQTPEEGKQVFKSVAVMADYIEKKI